MVKKNERIMLLLHLTDTDRKEARDAMHTGLLFSFYRWVAR